jgi:hypothetical protein
MAVDSAFPARADPISIHHRTFDPLLHRWRKGLFYRDIFSRMQLLLIQ